MISLIDARSVRKEFSPYGAAPFHRPTTASLRETPLKRCLPTSMRSEHCGLPVRASAQLRTAIAYATSNLTSML